MEGVVPLIILCHDRILDFGITTTFSKTVAMATFSEIATTTMFLNNCLGNEILAVMSLQLEIEDDHGGVVNISCTWHRAIQQRT